MKIYNYRHVNVMLSNFTLRPQITVRNVFAVALIWVMMATMGMAQLTLTSSPYTQDFNGIENGLPTGWTVRTSATATSLGTAPTFVTTKTGWGSSTGQFSNLASANPPATSSDNTTTQNNNTDRAPGVRQSGGFGDPGAAFVLQLDNTLGLTNFELDFKLMSVGVAGRTTIWKVDYGFGDTPSSFTEATTTPSTLETSGTWGSTNVHVNFGSALDNQSGSVWVRIVTKDASTGTGARPHTAIDDLSLSFSSGGSTPQLNVGALNSQFGDLCVGAISATKEFEISGSDLPDEEITIGPLDGFEFSFSGDEGDFHSDLFTEREDGTLELIPIYVRFKPTEAKSYAGNIPVQCGSVEESCAVTSATGDGPAVPVATEATGITATSFFANADVADCATSYYLDVWTGGGGSEEVLASWNFNDENQVADGGIAANSSATVIAVGDLNIKDYTTGPLGSGAGDKALTADNWAGGANSKYWQTTISTEGYTDIKLSSKQAGSNTGPRDFKVQYKIGSGGTWTDISGATVTVANNWTAGVLNKVALPTECNDQEELYIRWIMTSNTSVNNGTVANGGTSRIDDIIIKGSQGGTFILTDVEVTLPYEVTGLDPETTYFYRVRSGNGSLRSANSNTIEVTTAAAVENNNCSGAIDLTPNTDGFFENPGAQSLVNATYSGVPVPSGCSTNTYSRDMWYKLTTNNNGIPGEPFTITLTPNAGTDVAIALYKDDCQALENLTCVDNGGNGVQETLEWHEGDEFAGNDLETRGEDDNVSYLVRVMLIENSTPGSFTITGTGSALPVNLISFDAHLVDGKQVVLDWAVTAEENLDGYIVERSTDGRTFSAIAKVNAAQRKSYSMTDSKPAKGVNYYRLKMLDRNSAFKLSEVRQVVFSQGNVLALYPNPTSGLMYISGLEGVSTTANVTINDDMGRIVWQGNLNGNQLAGGRVDMTSYASGTYVIRVIAEGVNTAIRFVKQ